MATIEAAVAAAQQAAANGYEPIDAPTSPMTPPVPGPQAPWLESNTLVRCPLPMIFSYPDQLRQFYRWNVPLTRVIPVKT